MSDERKPLDPVEALRLEVERTRLELDRASYMNEHTRTFLERWRTDVQPIHEAAERSREMAYGYAKLAIQTMFLLNGGALIVFPAFAQLVGTAFRDHVVSALLSVGGFVSGLVLIGVTTLLAYLSMDADAAAIRQYGEVVKINLNQSQDPDAKAEKYETPRSVAAAAQERHYRRANVMRWWAVGLGVGSMVAFVFGALYAARVLSAA